jgi:BarA-like signal transduction histidine kinase
MTENNKETKDFIVALASDDYIQADKLFPNVVKNALEKLINNKKPAVFKQLSAQAEQIAKDSLNGQTPKA